MLYTTFGPGSSSGLMTKTTSPTDNKTNLNFSVTVAKKNILLRSKKKKAQALIEGNRLEEAAALLAQLGRSAPMDADIWLGLGFLEGKKGNHAGAAEHFRKAVSIQPNNAQFNYNLGIALRDSGNYEAAISAFRNTLKSQPDFGDAGACLAHAYMVLGRLDESEHAFRSAIRHHPDNAELHSNLGTVLQTKGLVDEAVTCYRDAIRLNPNLPAYDSFGSALTGQGKFDEALAAYREGLRRQPDNVRVYSNLLLTLNYMPDSDPGEVFAEHRRWGRIHGQPAEQIQIHGNNRDPARRLRVGYVSPDFRTHSVAYYMEPLLAAHHREVVEAFCYSMMPRPDATTERLRSLADQWRDIHGWSDKRLVERIQADKIDILVDLAGHTAHNSLTAFARKPAPVQVTYLGYPNTTGLPVIDYRLTDAVVDPEGVDGFFSEELARLPGCFLCYQPLADAPAVAPLPAIEAGYLTFGSFNNLSKINPHVVEAWSRAVKAVPNSKLLVKNPALTDPGRRDQYYSLFEAQDIGKEQVELMGHTPTREEHLALYGRVDIALDTFPYNGTATTCEALWMGVPVMTLSGTSHAGRVGKSLLTSVGLDEWIADSSGDFVTKIAELAADVGSLALLRHKLRDRLVASPLCDSETFAHNVEHAYRKMWRRWCNVGN
jgi:predicted O-linked N-acetylglucosamine transferase (SPINDLY family)